MEPDHPLDDRTEARGLRSIGLETDLMFHRFGGEVVDLGDALAIRTPAEPSYFWGNYLLYRSPPAEGDAERWLERYRNEIGDPLGVDSVAFAWDAPDGAEGVLEPFLELGFEVERQVVLVAPLEALSSAHGPPEGVALRPLTRDAEWAALLELQVESRAARFRETPYRTFRERRLAHYRAMVDAGRGSWFGAFEGPRGRGAIVGGLGIFVERGVARYQHVETRREYRRRGIAGGLLLAAGRWAARRRGARQLVIVAEAGSGALRLYRSLGFEPRERLVSLIRSDPAQTTDSTVAG